MIIKHSIGLLALACLSMGTSAGIIFEDNFDSEAGSTGASALNYTSFTHWTVGDGTVDVVANGGWGISCAGSGGKCIDLDGSNNNAGIFSSHELLLSPGNYMLSVDVSGNQRSGSDTMRMTLGSYVNEFFVLGAATPWQTIALGFVVSASSAEYLTFFHDGGDNIGMLLDNVSLSALNSPTETPVAEPAAMSLIGLGLVGLGLARRQRRTLNQT